MGKHPVARAHAKRLLRVFKEQQQYDYPVSATSVVAAKYLFQQSHRCFFVEVKIGPGDEKERFILQYSLLPKFITSQLDAQQLTSLCSRGVATSVILDFIYASFCVNPLRKKGYPTLFR